MSTEGSPGFFAALWRFFTFWKLRKALGLVRAADAQFTGSTRGISDAFDIQKDHLVTQYNEMFSAVSEVENILETDRLKLTDLNKEEQDLLVKRDGAMTEFERAKAAGDQAAMARHQDAFNRFDARILKIEEEQKALAARIGESSKGLDDYMRQLTKMQAEIRQMPEEKARALADFVSSSKIIDLNRRLQGIQTSMERGPIEAVLAHNRKLTAEARVSQKLAGTDVARQDEAYARSGLETASGTRMEQLLAARKAERDAKTGATQANQEKDGRPQI